MPFFLGGGVRGRHGRLCLSSPGQPGEHNTQLFKDRISEKSRKRRDTLESSVPQYEVSPPMPGDAQQLEHRTCQQHIQSLTYSEHSSARRVFKTCCTQCGILRLARHPRPILKPKELNGGHGGPVVIMSASSVLLHINIQRVPTRAKLKLATTSRLCR